MANINEKLQLILDSKISLKNAIKEKIPEFTSDVFSEYASKISEIYQKGQDELASSIPTDSVMYSDKTIVTKESIMTSDNATIYTGAQTDLLKNIGTNQVMKSDKSIVTVPDGSVMKSDYSVVTIDSLQYLDNTCKLIEQADGGYQVTKSDGTLLATIPASNVSDIVAVFDGGGEATITTNE